MLFSATRCRYALFCELASQVYLGILPVLIYSSIIRPQLPTANTGRSSSASRFQTFICEPICTSGNPIQIYLFLFTYLFLLLLQCTHYYYNIKSPPSRISRVSKEINRWSHCHLQENTMPVCSRSTVHEKVKRSSVGPLPGVLYNFELFAFNTAFA